MKLNKLNMRGFSHDIALVFIVVLFAIVGVGLLVASHADAPTKLIATCSIANVPPDPDFGEVIDPSLTISISSGTGSYNPNPVYYEVVPAGTAIPTTAGTTTASFPPSLDPGTTASTTLGPYNVPYSNGNRSTENEYIVWFNTAAIEATCTSQFALPVQPTTGTTNPTPPKKTTPSPKAFRLSNLNNSGAPNTDIPANKSSFTMPCYKGAGSTSNGSYTITAATSQGNVQVTMCYYQSFTATILPSGSAARLYLAGYQYVDVPLKGGGASYVASCNGSPATGPTVPVNISGTIVNTQICSNYSFSTTPVYN